jgi:AbrB family looped-hinge helix DNA binding protein
MGNGSLTIERRRTSPLIERLGQRGRVLIPKDIREDIGLQAGDFIDVRQVNHTIVISPRWDMEEDKELTPRQRAYIDKRLAEAMDDIKHGRVSPVFSSADALIRHLHEQAKKLKKPKK